jgi:DNA invertase Pin-like site-specific DNA recombinase
MTRVGIYIRVSCEREREILENQRRNAIEYANTHGWSTFTIYEDIASGGTDNRPGLNALRDDVKARKLDLIIFTSVSRMTRAGISAALYILNELKSHGVGWHFVEQPSLNFDANTNLLARDIILSVLAAIDEEYRRNISLKTKAALKRRAALGQRLGRHPKGCDCEKHRKKASPPHDEGISEKINRDVSTMNNER